MIGLARGYWECERAVNTWTVVLILAVVQGVAEFLPISSSGHLVILSDLLRSDAAVFDVSDVNIMLHVGTLFSILVYYWRRVLRLLTEDRRLIGVLVVATLPAVLVGVPIKMFAEGVLEHALLAGLLLPVTGVVLLAAARFGHGGRAYTELSWSQALLIGCSQAFAVLPGLSRSGLTISTGMYLGLAPTAAGAFSFLMAIPAIAGAGLLESISALRSGGFETAWQLLVAGMVLSFVVGLASIWVLDHMLRRRQAQYFAYWCIPVGLLFAAGKILEVW